METKSGIPALGTAEPGAGSEGVKPEAVADSTAPGVELAAPAPAPPARGGALAGNSILMVEDNPVTQHIVRSMLEGLGARVEVADCGQAALERVAGQCFDLILMDCRMPVMDGFEATRHIRRREGAPKPAGSLRSPEATRTPIIALTANDMGGDRERCLAAGMDDFLSKTGLPAELRDCLERWLPAGGSRDRLRQRPPYLIGLLEGRSAPGLRGAGPAP